MTFTEKLASLSGPYEFENAIVVTRQRRLGGLIPYTQFDCKLWVVERPQFWRVMLSSDKSPYRKYGPYWGAYFRVADGSRDSAWEWTLADRQWHPVRTDPEATMIFDRIEDAVSRAKLK